MIEQIVNKIRNDFRFISTKLLKIKDKKGNIVSLILNAAQEKVYIVYLQLKESGKPIRIIILKARQEGISTIFEAIIFQRNSYSKNRKAIIIGHIKEASDNLFDMFKRFYKYLPPELQPETKHSNEKKLSYKRLDSEIVVYTAESGEAGRSATIQDLHATEVAFWRDAKTTMTGLLQTIPDEPNTMSVIESTANGIGGYFYDMWEAAVKGENDYTPIFLAWFNLDEYTRPFESEEEKAKFKPNDYEKTLIKAHNLTLEQMNWYRFTLKNKLGGDEDKMKQEYPSNPKEAFTTTGRPVFNTQICFTNYESSENGLTGDLVEIEDKIKFVLNPKGYLRLFRVKKPSEYESYTFAAGVDVAEGLEQGDYSVCKVLDRRTDEVVLTWHGHADVDIFAQELMKIQRYLKGDIWFEIEKNNNGLAVIMKGNELGLNIKYREDFNDGIEKTEMHDLGFITNKKTKPFIINQLNEWIRDGLFIDREQEFWGECLTFVRNAKGQMSAQNKLSDPATKTFDDRVIAEALMLNCSLWLPNYQESEKSKLPAWYEKEMSEELEDNYSVMGV